MGFPAKWDPSSCTHATMWFLVPKRVCRGRYNTILSLLKIGKNDVAHLYTALLESCVLHIVVVPGNYSIINRKYFHSFSINFQKIPWEFLKPFLWLHYLLKFLWIFLKLLHAGRIFSSFVLKWPILILNPNFLKNCRKIFQQFFLKFFLEP